ncbi:endonuclease/exonuclease/phosphatase family protein [Maribacter sp. CXY002]|uniref:endonuclease/exonuclease/phosphatase family protein n=1 Tax=Maribacter luteocoastalis TaxID=3407671 RepID=UPI003B67444C
MKELSFFSKLVFIINTLVALLLLLACLVPYINSGVFSFLSLTVPVLVVGNFLFLLYWLFFNRKYIWTSLFALIIGYFALGSFVEFRFKNSKTLEDDISVLTFNSLGFNGLENSEKRENGDKILAFIQTQDPDIVCFQEFDIRRAYSGDFDAYPYQFITKGGLKKDHVSQAILSKFPIIQKNDLDFPESANHAIYADLVINKDTVSVYNLHLESLKVRPGMIKREPSNKLLKRLSYSFSKQQEQARLIRAIADANDNKKIVTGDFNNTQFSSAYRIIKGDMNDSFSEKGSGYGKTINFWHFPLRIDFILADNDFEVLSHENFKISLSDHEPVMATFKLSGDK